MMSHVFFRFSLVAITLFASVCRSAPYSPLTASAASPLTRIAFQLTGPSCTAQQGQLLSSLSEVEGVRSVDLTSIADHALVDIDLRLLSAHELAPIVQNMMPTGCRAEPMESCISAMPLNLAVDMLHSTDGQDRHY